MLTLVCCGANYVDLKSYSKAVHRQVNTKLKAIQFCTLKVAAWLLCFSPLKLSVANLLYRSQTVVHTLNTNRNKAVENETEQN